jgi:hypothetical protein
MNSIADVGSSIPHSEFRTPQWNWSPEKELHPQHLFVGET